MDTVKVHSYNVMHVCVSLSPVPKDPSSVQQVIITPKVHMLGETGASIAFIRLIQSVDK